MIFYMCQHNIDRLRWMNVKVDQHSAYITNSKPQLWQCEIDGPVADALQAYVSTPNGDYAGLSLEDYLEKMFGGS